MHVFERPQIHVHVHRMSSLDEDSLNTDTIEKVLNGASDSHFGIG